MFKKYKNIFLNLLFPKRCISCKKNNYALCEECFQKIKISEFYNSNTYSLYDYGDKIIQKIIKGLKYKNDKRSLEDLIKFSINKIKNIIKNHQKENGVFLIPIPQHKNKKNLKGFNQSEIIAKIISSQLKIEKLNLLIKFKNTKSQVEIKSRSKRLKNVTHSMYSKIPENQNSLFIIIDDVSTTGATINEAMRALKESGAKNLISIVLAHGYKN